MFVNPNCGDDKIEEWGVLPPGVWVGTAEKIKLWELLCFNSSWMKNVTGIVSWSIAFNPLIEVKQWKACKKLHVWKS